MAKNLKRYYQAWEYRQQGKKLAEIATLMGFRSGENARRMIHFIDLKIKSKQNKSEVLKKLMMKWPNSIIKIKS
ncbi:MAG: hypothetical protein WA061_03125 [Microgenomates group bacterium]